MKIILTDLPNVRVFLTLQTSGNGKLTPVGKHDNLHIINETDYATCKYCIINIKVAAI